MKILQLTTDGAVVARNDKMGKLKCGFRKKSFINILRIRAKYISFIDFVPENLSKEIENT